MDYKNGQIYKLISDHTDKIYIGSTCRDLRKRLHDHKGSYTAFGKGKCNNITSFELFKLGEVDIILIEKYPCKDKTELHSRERYFIEHYKDIVINKVLPTRSSKEWRHYNKEKLSENSVKYRANNKQKIQKYRIKKKKKLSLTWKQIKKK